MSSISKLDSALRSAVKSVGQRHVRQLLEEVAETGQGGDILTIIVNEGIHTLGAKHWRGEVFAASRGSLDFSNARSVTSEYRKVLGRTARKLKERSWRRIYIVPFGPTTLAMQIKLLVYRITGIESIDVAHIGENRRVDIEIDLRQVAERSR